MATGRLDKEYTILENIYHKPEKVRQRDLAHIAGISLGMTNVILKRLVKKGLVIARKINHRNIHYAVTPSGINAIMQRSYRYFKRTIKNIVFYKEKIKQLIHVTAADGFRKIVLVGKSDLDFIIEYCVRQENMTLAHQAGNTENNSDPSTCYIFSEKTRDREHKHSGNHVSLYDYLQTTPDEVSTPRGRSL